MSKKLRTNWQKSPTYPGLWWVDDGTGEIGLYKVYRFGGSFVFVSDNDKEVFRISARQGWLWSDENLP